MSNAKIITVTLNPSLDRTLTTHYMAPGYQNRTIEPSLLYPAGRGVNVSRALHALRSRTYAVISLGDDAIGVAYKSLIKKEGFPVKVLMRPGLTRSNIVIRDTGHAAETLLIEESTGVTPEHLQIVADSLQTVIESGDIVVFAGELPEGMAADTYYQLAATAHQSGAMVAVATHGEPLKQVLKANPNLVALNQLETESLFGHPVRTQEDMVYCAQALLKKGVSRTLILSSESDSAILAAESDVWWVDLPDFEPGTSSGVADALLAGYLAGRAMQIPLKKSLKLGAASATYAASQVGNEFGSPSEVAEIITDIVVSPPEAK